MEPPRGLLDPRRYFNECEVCATERLQRSVAVEMAELQARRKQSYSYALALARVKGNRRRKGMGRS